MLVHVLVHVLVHDCGGTCAGTHTYTQGVSTNEERACNSHTPCIEGEFKSRNDVRMMLFKPYKDYLTS